MNNSSREDSPFDLMPLLLIESEILTSKCKLTASPLAAEEEIIQIRQGADSERLFVSAKIVVLRDTIKKEMNIMVAFGGSSEDNSILRAKSMYTLDDIREYLTHVILENFKKDKDLQEIDLTENKIFKLTLPLEKMTKKTSELFQAKSVTINFSPEKKLRKNQE
jgi:hypothetical protein